MSSNNFIPRNDAEFNDWFKNLVNYVVSKTNGANPPWDHILLRHILELVAASDDWRNYYTPTLTPHTPAAITAKNDARKRAESCSKVLRTFALRSLR